MEPDDAQLLKRYARDGSQEAFADLARRHAGLLYHTALRRTGQAELAEEAAQNALAILARKAASLCSPGGTPPSLAGWLHRAVCFEASKLSRGERRHSDRMKKLHDSAPEAGPEGLRVSVSATVPSDLPGESGVWESVTPHLDEALNELSEPDRQVVLLKYFDGWSFEEMARRLGGQSAAWRQRGSRALERLRRRLSRRGVIVPLAVLSAGLGQTLTQTAPAAVTAALTGTAPLATAATLSWKTLTLHTLHTMNAKQLALTAALAAALFVPLGFQASAVSRSAAELAVLENTSASLNAAALADAGGGGKDARRGKSGQGRGGADLPDKPGDKTENDFDLMELAKLMADGRNADPLRILSFRARLAAMGAEEIGALLESAKTMDLPASQRRLLYERLLSSMAEKDAAKAMGSGMGLVGTLAGEDANLFWMNPLPNVLRRWAMDDPAAASAWYAEQLKSEAFENKALGNSDLDGWMAAGLFTGLMWGKDRAAGMALYDSLDDAGKGISLRRFGTSNSNPEDRALILKLAAGISDMGARADALTGPTLTLARTDLDQTGTFIAQANLPAAEARKLLVAAAVEPLKSTKDVDVDARVDWLRAQTPPDQKDKALGYFLGEATFTDHAGIKAKVDAELAAGASDAFLGAFIRNAAHRTSTMEIAAGYLEKLTDPTERARTLREIQQGHTEAARAAAISAGVTATELDAALSAQH